MNFLNLKSKVVDFVVFDLEIWAKKHELEIDFELLNAIKGVSFSRVRVGGISTFHKDEYGEFYCNDEFVLFLECHRDFPDEVPEVRKMFFARTKVNEERVGRLLFEINSLSNETEIKLAPDYLNIWKAESCELALAG